MKNGWTTTMVRKVDIIIRGIEENWDQVFIHSDVDIQFFKPMRKIILDCIQDNDMAIQSITSTGGGVCPGFFACRGNERTLTLWKEIKELLEKNPKQNDQTYLNRLVFYANPYGIKWVYLPYEQFFSPGKYWSPKDKMTIPKEIVMHHANWTIGLENKLLQLNYVKNKVRKIKNY